MTAAAFMIHITMFASASPASVSGGPTGGGGSPSQTDPTTVTVLYGVAPLTYAWEKVSGGPVSASAPTAATTAFTAAAVDVPTTAAFRCLVTDARGLTAYTNSVAVELTA